MNCTERPLARNSAPQNRKLSSAAEDLLECLYSSSSPLSETQIACKVPWIPNISSLLEELILSGEVSAHAVRLSTNPSCNGETSVPNFGTIFTSTSRQPSSHPLELAQIDSIDSLQGIGTAVHRVLEQHGLSVVPKQYLPSITAESMNSELAALKELRRKFVDRLAQLNDALALASGNEDVNNEEDDASPFPTSTHSIPLARLEEHKRSKDLLRSEVKELLQVLAGVLADHKNVSILDIISEYKNL